AYPPLDQSSRKSRHDLPSRKSRHDLPLSTGSRLAPDRVEQLSGAEQPAGAEPQGAESQSRRLYWSTIASLGTFRTLRTCAAFLHRWVASIDAMSARSTEWRDNTTRYRC